MLRIALLLLILIIILVAAYLPNFRRALGMMLLVLMGATGFIIWQDTREWELEFQRIPIAQAQLSNMIVRPGLNSRVVCGDWPASECRPELYPTFRHPTSDN